MHKMYNNSIVQGIVEDRKYRIPPCGVNYAERQIHLIKKLDLLHNIRYSLGCESFPLFFRQLGTHIWAC
jgi:hypothetical protein